MEIIAESRYRFVIPRHGRMRVPGVVFATRVLIPDPAADHALEQVANVAELPGIVEASYALPDVHWGYGFPIGGVAATGVARGGVVSPGGVGFDIACGVRLLAADLGRDDLLPVLGQVMDRLAAVIPCGAGRGGIWKLHGRAELDKLLAGGAGHAVACGHGGERDLDRCEDHGVAGGADPAQVSSRAVDRGLHQVGSLGPGNHFLEVQAVDRVFDLAAAQAFGLAEGQVCVMIHCGSRGLGHQVCSDHVLIMDKAMARYRIAVPDWQLACAPVTSPEGRRYLGALAAAANYARANGQVLAAAASAVLAEAAGAPLHLVYDVAHNLATLETHPVGGVPVRLCVHRKGATRALPPGHPDLVGADNLVIAADLGVLCWMRGVQIERLAARGPHGRALSVLVSIRFTYLPVLRMFCWLALFARSDRAKHAEVLILRNHRPDRARQGSRLADQRVPQGGLASAKSQASAYERVWHGTCPACSLRRVAGRSAARHLLRIGHKA